MTLASLPLLLALFGPGAPPRNYRPLDGGSPAAAPPAAGLSDAEVAERVRTYLGSIDTPIPMARWRSLGQRAVAPLENVVRGGELPSRRARALAALSAIGGDRAKRIVLQMVHAEGEPFAVRTSALRGAANLLSTHDLAAELRPVMEGAHDATIRATAADELSRHAASSSCEAVRAQAERESDSDRRQFVPALERCAGG
ncbi:MAG TPA: hypothetical protein VMK12_11230 [Anaeromyxobacteraceae bacterium]|nr:hypothetical protein [Anaeromyxobacteraceae bacterium]